VALQRRVGAILARRATAAPSAERAPLNAAVHRFPGPAPAGTIRTMRLRIMLPLAAAVLLATAAGARADTRHTVTPGESLSSLAVADGVSITALAGATRLSPDAQLLIGAVLRTPPRGTGIPGARRRHSPPAPRGLTHRYVVRRGDSLSSIAARAGESVAVLAAQNHVRPDGVLLVGATLELPGAAPATRHGSAAANAGAALHRYVIAPGDTLSALAAHASVDALLIAGATLLLPGPAGAGAPASATAIYIVRPGDTLSSIAARSATSWTHLAAINGIAPGALLLAGEALRVPASSGGPPYPTPERVSLAQIEEIARSGGVPGSLAAAIAWQESGFNNDLVSNADARGVMQILPGTWSWIERTLTPQSPLAPSSAADNVRGGVLLLRSLLDETGGNMDLAIAGYIQGLDSVRRNGMYAVTAQYVHDVLALRRQFAAR
jgi:LysM repeat protein